MYREYIEVFKMNKHFIQLHNFIPFIFLFVSIYIILFSCYKRIEVDITKLILGIIFLIFSIYICACTCLSMYKEVSQLYIPYKRGEYKTVEGVVENLSLIKKSSEHDVDSFKVNNQVFSYHGISLIGPYEKCACDGGFIRKEGQHVKIYYIPIEYQGEITNHIVGLFLDSDELENLKKE